MKSRTIWSLALTLGVFGCSKSEVLHELTVVEKPAAVPNRAEGSEPKKALADEASECREKGGGACERLLERRAEVEVAEAALSKQAWLEALASGCIKAPARSVCDGVLALLYRSRSEGFDPAPIIAMSEAACDNGQPAGCVLAANAYLRTDTELEAHQHKSTRLFERACRQGSTPACARAAAGYLTEAALFSDDARRVLAVELTRSPCEAGDADACMVQAEATIAQIRPEEARDYVEARRLVKKACEANWPKACNYHADLMLRGLGGERNVTDGVATFERTCAREVPHVGGGGDEVSAYACAALAYLHAGREQILPKTPELARRFARRACELYSRRVASPCPLEPEIEEMLSATAP